MSETHEPSSAQRAPQIDPAQLAYAMEQLRSQQNLGAGLVVGLIAALAGAGIWAAVTVITGYQIGFMAIGVGLLVGFAVRSAGKGIDSTFGYVGAGLSLLGCAVGNLLAVCGFISQQEGMPILEVLAQLQPALVQELMVATFSPMDLLFYAIAVYEGYRFSFRPLGEEELRTLLPGH